MTDGVSESVAETLFLRVGGRRVHAATGGAFDPSLPAVVLIHGAGTDNSIWTLQSRYLARHGRRVLAFDLPGHGRSEGAPIDSIPGIADWLVQALDAAGVARAALVGHAMGALVALEVAARHPGRVRALALLGVADRMPVPPALLGAAATLDGPDDDPGGPGVLETDLAACNGYRGAAAAGMRVRCPALLLLGQADGLAPARFGRALAAFIPGSEVHVLPETGHMMMIDAPDATMDALISVV